MPSLSESDRRAVLQLARKAILEAVARAQILGDIPTSGIFSERRGVFVTLHCGGRLRGCIGVVEPSEPFGESVVRCAAGAALQDARFPAMRPEELGSLQVEISILSAPLPISPEGIEIGRHGLLIVSGAKRGLLLPQVAIEHHLSVEQFLEETCRKAQLPPAAWREAGTHVSAFTCEVFSEASPAD